MLTKEHRQEYSCPNLAAIQMSINRRIDKYLMKFLPYEKLHRNKRAEKK